MPSVGGSGLENRHVLTVYLKLSTKLASENYSKQGEKLTNEPFGVSFVHVVSGAGAQTVNAALEFDARLGVCVRGVATGNLGRVCSGRRSAPGIIRTGRQAEVGTW